MHCRQQLVWYQNVVGKPGQEHLCKQAFERNQAARVQRKAERLRVTSRNARLVTLIGLPVWIWCAYCWFSSERFFGDSVQEYSIIDATTDSPVTSYKDEAGIERLKECSVGKEQADRIVKALTEKNRNKTFYAKATPLNQAFVQKFLLVDAESLFLPFLLLPFLGCAIGGPMQLLCVAFGVDPKSVGLSW
jgi:hypothetical protein